MGRTLLRERDEARANAALYAKDTERVMAQRDTALEAVKMLERSDKVLSRLLAESDAAALCLTDMVSEMARDLERVTGPEDPALGVE